MLRLIFDTNVYSSIAKDKNFNKIVEKIKDEKEIRIYGYKVIKEEIKDIPKSIKYENHKLRTFLINLYYDIIKEQYPESQSIKRLAEIYYKEFKKLGIDIKEKKSKGKKEKPKKQRKIKEKAISEKKEKTKEKKAEKKEKPKEKKEAKK